jgi:hypothetical protein
MQFRTEIETVNFPFSIKKNDRIVTVGSCFAEVFGQYLSDHKLNCLSNPYGVIFNPVSLFRLLNQSIGKQPVMKNLTVQNQGHWFHYDFHSKYYNKDAARLEEELNQLHETTGEALRKADYLILTLGTAFVHRLARNEYIVANCHKQSASLFRRELLSQKEIMVRFRQFYENLRIVNPKVKLIFTVSPVRHTKDTLQGNNLSKSILRVVSHYFSTEFKNCYYFPAYEILMDDLRDYRYYESDMIHVNETGQKYVIENFRKSALSKETNEFIDYWGSIQNQLNHKPYHIHSEEHQKFLRNLFKKLEEAGGEINVDEEKALIKSQLI